MHLRVGPVMVFLIAASTGGLASRGAVTALGTYLATAAFTFSMSIFDGVLILFAQKTPPRRAG